MTMQDPISDMLSRINNAQRVKHKSLTMPSSHVKKAIAHVLKEEGYIHDYMLDEANAKKPSLILKLKYCDGRPVIEKLRRISTCGLRVYKRASDLPKVRGGLGIAIVTTSKGVMTAKQARALNEGGEILCYIH